METMSSTPGPAAASAPIGSIDLEALKARQKVAWASGDYAVVGTTLQIVGETLCETLDIRAGQSVLDVAAGNGNATLAAARRWCVVTSTDYVPALLEKGRARAEAEGLAVTFQPADAEDLPFPPGGFDVAISTFGVMFAPNQDHAAAEMLRVVKPGGKVGLANWTPDGFIGQLFKVLGGHVPPPPGARSPILWGTRERLTELFGAGGDVRVHDRVFKFRYRSPAHLLEVFRTWYGPVHKAFASLPEDRAAALEGDLLALIDRFDEAKDGTAVVPSRYVDVVVKKAD